MELDMSETTLGIGSRINHASYDSGVIIRIHKMAYDVCFIDHGIKQIGRNNVSWEVIEAIEPDVEISFTEAEKSMSKILKHWLGLSETIDLGDKWDGGTMTLTPGTPGLSSKEIPIESFFHKVVMTRDRLRVMEQRINASALKDEEKVNLQQYITRIYGSLTSFNVLFKHKEDHFKGTKL